MTNEHTDAEYQEDIDRLSRLQLAAEDVIESGVSLELAAVSHEVTAEQLTAHIDAIQE